MLRAPRDLPAPSALLDRKASLAHRDLKETLALLGLLGPPAQLDPKDPPVHKDQLVLWGQPV